MFILEFDPKTGYLPPGIHNAEWSDIALFFAVNSHRVRLLEGLLAACHNLAAAGCRKLLLDGSFVSRKLRPGDYDAAWETAGVNRARLDPVLLDFSNNRKAMKAKYLGELFPATELVRPGVFIRDFFQTDRHGVKKGVLLIDLGSLP